MRFKAWTASGSIIAVWDRDDGVGTTQSPVICIIDAASGQVTKTISLPIQADEEFQPWERMQGDFSLDAFALSPDQNVLALACGDQDLDYQALVWIINLVSGEVVFRQVDHQTEKFQLAFSGANDVLAVLSIGFDMDEGEGVHSVLALLQATSGAPMLLSSITGCSAYSSPGHTAFILPLPRTILFLSTQDSNDNASFKSFHVPAAAKHDRDGRYLPPHAYAGPGTSRVGAAESRNGEGARMSEDEENMAVWSPKSCRICDSRTLDAGSVSPCGRLFVTLGSAEGQAALEHWQLDFQSSSCHPHLVCMVPLGPLATSLPEPCDEKANPVHLLVDWHPSSGNRLLHAVAVQEGPGLIYIVHDCQHTVQHSVNLADHGSFTGPISCLRWSPDGRALAVLAQTSVYIIAAG